VIAFELGRKRTHATSTYPWWWPTRGRRRRKAMIDLVKCDEIDAAREIEHLVTPRSHVASSTWSLAHISG
jgi:hypothetical protein